MASRPPWTGIAPLMRAACPRSRPRLQPPASRTYPRFASSSPVPPANPSPAGNGGGKARASHRGFYIPLSLLIFIPALYYLRPAPPSTLSPSTYSDHPISSSIALSPSHRLITVPLDSSSRAAFRPSQAGSFSGEESNEDDGEVVVHHVMIKNPDLQIERPYTPLNDVLLDGEMNLVIKRVKGGEVGRHVHAIPVGGETGLRGPLETLRITPGDWDRVIMISSGTGVAPFLQLLSKASPSSVPPGERRGERRRTQYQLLHAPTKEPSSDWILSSSLPLLAKLQEKHGDALRVDRISLDPLDRAALSRALQREKNEKVMILVCLPPHLMRPICGPLTITLGQGELTGVLKDLGLRGEEVWKLE